MPEYWFADLRRRAILVHRLANWRYPEPLIVGLGETLTSPLLPGFALPITTLFA